MSILITCLTLKYLKNLISYPLFVTKENDLFIIWPSTETVITGGPCWTKFLIFNSPNLVQFGLSIYKKIKLYKHICKTIL